MRLPACKAKGIHVPEAHACGPGARACNRSAGTCTVTVQSCRRVSKRRPPPLLRRPRAPRGPQHRQRRRHGPLDGRAPGRPAPPAAVEPQHGPGHARGAAPHPARAGGPHQRREKRIRYLPRSLSRKLWRPHPRGGSGKLYDHEGTAARFSHFRSFLAARLAGGPVAWGDLGATSGGSHLQQLLQNVGGWPLAELGPLAPEWGGGAA